MWRSVKIPCRDILLGTRLQTATYWVFSSSLLFRIVTILFTDKKKNSMFSQVKVCFWQKSHLSFPFNFLQGVSALSEGLTLGFFHEVALRNVDHGTKSVLEWLQNCFPSNCFDHKSSQVPKSFGELDRSNA